MQIAKITSVIGLMAISAFAVDPPSWVGTSLHTWSPQLGGGVWFQEKVVVDGIATAITEYPRPVLVGLRSDWAEQGYQFDKDIFHFPSGGPAAPVSHEYVLQTLGATGNAEFMWSMPVPDHYSSTPYTTLGGAGFPWQKPEYYAAYLQYLTEPTNMTPTQISGLATNLSFFSDTTYTTPSTVNESLVHTNWGNLRARRGHVQPYSLQAVILGIEPNTDAQESLLQGSTPDGGRYGTIAHQFRQAIRNRGSRFGTANPGRTSVLSTIPLGLVVDNTKPMDTYVESTPWFSPMLNALGGSTSINNLTDFTYLDMPHKYQFNSASDDVKRFYPTFINNTTQFCCWLTDPAPCNTGSTCSPGWQDGWVLQSSWPPGVDFKQYLWWYQDVRYALNNYADGSSNHENASRWKLGCAEHGLSISSQAGAGNDMGAGLNWALWLAESMRYNAVWDMNWVLCEQGNSHAQLQFKDSHLTRTPAHYVYKMAQEFYGYSYLTNTYASPTYTTGTCDGAPYRSDDLVVRTFRNSADGDHHLFVVNKSSSSINITGWESWTVRNWGRISASSYTAQNPIGNPWSAETVKTVPVTHTAGQALGITGISVNHIELTRWRATNALATGRAWHTATRLSNGNVLIAGGLNAGTSCELFDASTGTWSSTGSLNAGRDQHTATLLNDGKVLVVGGYGALNSAQLYNPSTGTWSATGSLTVGRYCHTATLLSNGKVLVAGGTDSTGYLATTCELYDPATGTWSTTGSLNTLRHVHTATLLGNGKVLLLGGVGYAGTLASAELYDPSTGSWSTTGSMGTARVYATSVLLSNGKVLAAAGDGTTELYDPTAGTWSYSGSLSTSRIQTALTVLSDGKVLISGGATDIYMATTETYDPSLGTWSRSTSMHNVRGAHTATLLTSGKVLVVGGEDDDSNMLNSVEMLF